MDRRTHLQVLEEALRAQVGLLETCARRAVAARDPRLKSAWVGAVVRLMDASAATGSALAAIRWAPSDATLFQLAIRLRLPRLPPLPEIEGNPLPLNSAKQPQAVFASGSAACRTYPPPLAGEVDRRAAARR